MADKAAELGKWAIEAGFKPDDLEARTRGIHKAMLRGSDRPHGGDGLHGLDAPNFSRIHAGNLRLLFDLYDRAFFDGRLGRAAGRDRLSFRVSNRMTRAGGKTLRRKQRFSQAGPERFEIAVSSHLLFQSFNNDVERSVMVSGLSCNDRLEALQRIFEHELIHLLELLAWSESNCSAPRFRELAKRVFGHLRFTHDLVTSHEYAAVKYGIKVGDKVCFQIDGKRHAGFVNRICKRATVLVRHRKGARYSDGLKYLKFYVPIPRLERLP